MDCVLKLIEAAAVRIAMTVAVAGRHEGVLRKVTSEAGLESDAPNLTMSEFHGVINSDLTRWGGRNKGQVPASE